MDDLNQLEKATYLDAGNTTVDENGYQYTCGGACPGTSLAGQNRIIRIADNQDAPVATFEYDALGRRFYKYDHKALETTYYYYNDKWQVLCEYDSMFNLQREFFYGNYIDEVLVMNDGTDDYYYAHNHLFSPVALIDNTGSIAERCEYNAYGKAQVLTNSDQDGNWFDDPGDTIYAESQLGNPYLFTGRRLDTLDSGSLEIMYYRNRYYSTYTGRLLTHDPMSYVDGLNLYEYVRSQPVASYDPYGLELRLPDWGPIPPVEHPTPDPDDHNPFPGLYPEPPRGGGGDISPPSNVTIGQVFNCLSTPFASGSTLKAIKDILDIGDDAKDYAMSKSLPPDLLKDLDQEYDNRLHYLHCRASAYLAREYGCEIAKCIGDIRAGCNGARDPFRAVKERQGDKAGRAVAGCIGDNAGINPIVGSCYKSPSPGFRPIEVPKHANPSVSDTEIDSSCIQSTRKRQAQAKAGL